MNFIKTFLITLVIYLGLNAVFLVVSIFINPVFPLDDIFYIVSSLFSPIINTPGTTLIAAMSLITTFDLLLFLSILTLVIPPLVAVIVGARLGETGKISFLSWFLIAIISSIVYLLFAILGQGSSPFLSGVWTFYETQFGFIGAGLYLIITGVINGIFYGCFSFLFSKGGV